MKPIYNRIMTEILNIYLRLWGFYFCQFGSSSIIESRKKEGKSTYEIFFELRDILNAKREALAEKFLFH